MTRQRMLFLYILGVGLLALSVVIASLLHIVQMSQHDRLHWLPYAVLFVGLGWLCSRQQVYVSESNTVMMGTVAQIAAIIILPLSIALVVIGAAKLLSELSLRLVKQRSWRSVILNMGGSVLANAAAGSVFYALQGKAHLWNADISQNMLAIPALLGLGLCYHVVDSLPVTGAVTLTSGERPTSVFVQISKSALAPELSLIAVGIIFAMLLHFSPILSMIVIVPVYLSIRSFGAVARLHQETVEAVLRMAESIDYRDTGTHEHSERLADYSERLARALRLTPEHVKEVILASRVHDLGKIGISNDILLKQGPLTPQERQIMEEHPLIGATILSSYSSFREAVDIVKHHHERWDGTGYPAGLKGEGIPIGSRIISVVDSFDAMISDRPYRAGMSPSEAVERLKGAAGTQLDQRVCDSFIQLLIADGTYMPGETEMGQRLVERGSRMALKAETVRPTATR